MDQKLISLKGHFFITDERGNDVYKAIGKIISFGRQLTVSDTQGKEVLSVRQKLFSAHNAYRITPVGGKEVQMVRKIVSLSPQFVISKLAWRIKGDISAHNYIILCGGKVVATISKKWDSVSDKFLIDIKNEQDTLNVVGAALAIECVIQDNIMSTHTTSE